MGIEQSPKPSVEETEGHTEEVPEHQRARELLTSLVQKLHETIAHGEPLSVEAQRAR